MTINALCDSNCTLSAVLFIGKKTYAFDTNSFAVDHRSMNMSFFKKGNGTIIIAAGCVLIGAWIWRARFVRSRIAKEQASKRQAHEAPHVGANDVKVIVKVPMESLMGDVEERIPYTITQLENGKRETVTRAATIKFPAGMWSGLCVTK